MKNNVTNKILIVLLIALLIANLLLMPERVASDEPAWVPNGWHWDIIYAGTDMKAKENISIDGNFYIAYQVAKDKSQTHNDEKYHAWLIFDSKGTVVTNKDLYKKLAFTAEWSKRYRARRDREIKDNYEASLRDDYNKALRGLAMYEGGKVIVSVGSEIEGIIAKLIATGGAGGVSLASSFKDIAKNAVLEKFDVASSTKKFANWFGQEVIKTPSEAMSVVKTILIAVMKRKVVYAGDATNSLIDMFNQNLTVMSYENAQKFEENLYASAMGDPALTFLNDILPPAGWKTTFGLIGDKVVEGFIGISVTDAINDGKFLVTILGKNAIDNPIKGAFNKYNKRVLEYINAYDTEDATDIDKEGTTTYALYKDISKEYTSNNIGGLNIMQGAKFVLEFKTGASVDLNAILSDSNIPNPARAGDYVVWRKTLDDSIILPHKGTDGFKGYPRNTITFKFAVNSSGDFYIGSFGGVDTDHLFLFSNWWGTLNYKNFDGKDLPSSIYGKPRDRMLDLNYRNNLLGCTLSETYKQLFEDKCIIKGPSNYYELYNCPAILYNNTNKKVVVIDAYLTNSSKSIYPDPQNRAWTNMWSPIANNCSTSSTISRSFDINFVNATSSFLMISTGTDNSEYGSTTIFGLQNPPDYTSSGTNMYGASWAIKYDAANNSYTVHNVNVGTSSVFLKNQYPNHVDMSSHFTWARTSQFISIAIFGDDITATNLSESPSHDDGNPAPHKLIINPGLNK